MTATARESQIPLDAITHISAVPERVGGRLVAVIMGCEYLLAGRLRVGQCWWR